MYDFQNDGTTFLLESKRAILGDDPGLGKSRQALLAARGRVLIVAPAMILDAGVWQTEVAKWTPGLDVRAVSYSKLCKRTRGPKGGSVPLPEPADEWAGPWDTVIFDEAHYLKNRQTNWSQASLKIKTERLYLLTGTPIPNWAHELYMLIRLCNPGDRRFTSYWRWIEQWFDQNTISFGQRKVREIGGLKACARECRDLPADSPCHHWLEFQEENLGGQFLRRVRDDVLTDLPPMIETTIEVPMGPAQTKVYRAMKKDFLAVTESGTEILAWNTASQASSLRKASTGVEILDSKSKGSAKLDMLDTLMSDRGSGSSTLVLCHFRDTAAQIERRMLDLGLRVQVLTGATASKAQRRSAVEGFQAGEFEVLVGSLELVKEGLTLTRADQAILVEHSWRPSTNEQCIRRIHRIGQTRPVSVIHLVTAKTVDAGMQRETAHKTDQQMRALPVTRLRELV